MISRDPFVEVASALAADPEIADHRFARTDPMRQQRTGIPEVIYGDSKDDPALIVSCGQLLQSLPRVIVSRVALNRMHVIASAIGNDIDVSAPYGGQTIVLSRSGSEPPAECGFVAIFTAGTSDLSV